MDDDSPHHGRLHAGGLILLILALAGCASQQKPAIHDADPLEPVNRVFYKFNDVADTYVMRPVAKGYAWLIPAFARTGVNNFFENLTMPRNIVNAFLQGKGRQGLSDSARLLMNSTLGFAGLLDPATAAGLDRHVEDFGQTLYSWGVPQGPYLVVPVFGPRTIRHGTGSIVDWLYHPQRLIGPAGVRDKINITWLIHARSTLLGVDEQINRAFDEYSFVRDAYFQNRRFLLHDGQVPEDDLDLDFEDEGI